MQMNPQCQLPQGSPSLQSPTVLPDTSNGNISTGSSSPHPESAPVSLPSSGSAAAGSHPRPVNAGEGRRGSVFLPRDLGTLPVFTAGGQTYPTKGQRAHIFAFADHGPLIPTTQIWNYSKSWKEEKREGAARVICKLLGVGTCQ